MNFTREQIEQVRAALNEALENLDNFHPNRCKSYDNSVRRESCDCGVDAREKQVRSALIILDAALSLPEEREWGVKKTATGHIEAMSEAEANRWYSEFPRIYELVWRTPVGPWRLGETLTTSEPQPTHTP